MAAYFEPRYNFTKDLQGYVGAAGESISFPNRAAAEIDFYGGIRPTFGKLSLDFGVWYYWYPGGQCFSGNVNNNTRCRLLANGGGPQPVNGNVIKKDLSFWEVYAKASYAVTDDFTVGASVNYSPSVLNSGADGIYVAGNAKYVSRPVRRTGACTSRVTSATGSWAPATTSTAPRSPARRFGALPERHSLPDYTTWNVGVGFTWKVFTLDLRYIDTDLNKGDCNAFTGDHTATFTRPASPHQSGGSARTGAAAASSPGSRPT